MHNEQEERERLVIEYRAKKEQERKEKKASSSKADKLHVQGEQVAQASSELADKLPPQVARKADKLRKQASKQPVQDESLLAYWRDHPQASDQQVADYFGKSRQAIQQRRDKLVGKGEIRVTEAGVEIVGISVSMSVEKEQ
jgi:hypothetical protein